GRRTGEGGGRRELRGPARRSGLRGEGQRAGSADRALGGGGAGGGLLGGKDPAGRLVCSRRFGSSFANAPASPAIASRPKSSPRPCRGSRWTRPGACRPG